MSNSPFRGLSPWLPLLVFTFAIPGTASAKDLPKELDRYLETKTSLAPGLAEAVEEHFMSSDYGGGMSCSKAWNKSSKQAEEDWQLFEAYAPTACLKEPMRAYLREQALAITAANPGADACGADYPPSAVSVPDGSRPHAPADAVAWAHEPAAALAASIESSDTAARESWVKCVTTVNTARDAYAPLYAWFEDLGVVKDSDVKKDPEWPGGCSERLPADIGSDEQTSGQIAEAAAASFNMGSLSTIVSELSLSAVPLCHFGTQSVSLAQEYRAAAELNEALQKRVEEVDAAVADDLEKLVGKCPTKDDEHYEEVTNATMEWDDDNIGSAVSWAEKVVGGEGGRSGPVTGACVALSEYAEAVPDSLSELVSPHSAAIEAGAALAEEIAELLPALKEKKEEIDEALAAEREAERAADDAMYERCETLGDQAEARELDWKKCMSNADLTMTARQYSITDDELYHDHMEKQAVACAHGTGLAGALQVFLTQCQDEPDCNSEHIYEIDPYEGDVEELYPCELTFPDYAGGGW